MPVQPRTPPGVLELLPPQQLAFQRMLDVIRKGYERFGFLPVETPVFELTDVLLTKSGGETEKQVYFAQSTGALKSDKTPELALRFDLTVPLARYVAQHEANLNFPFRRYQIQRVYRGERNQRGRFREFYQCDIDAIGKDSLPLAYDAEMPAVIYGIFAELAIGKFTIYINNRKLLRGILESVGIAAEQQEAVLHEVDRLGKMERAEVLARVSAVAGADRAASLLRLLLGEDGAETSSGELLARLRDVPSNETLTTGLAELERVYQGTLALGVPPEYIKVNLAIVRGLDYYTGTIYETFLDAHKDVGSICSGGRYDNLAGHYTKSKLPGVGISIGATRLFWLLMELGLARSERASVADVMILNLDDKLAPEYAAIARDLRASGLAVEVYGEAAKLGKQFKYADRAKVPWVVVMGDSEHAQGLVKLKDMRVTDVNAKNEQEIRRAELGPAIHAAMVRREP